MRFIDIFAGLGGFRLALERLGHECVFASEIDSELQEVYSRNFPEGPAIYGDIRRSKGHVPPHDVLCAGFPCQPFSPNPPPKPNPTSDSVANSALNTGNYLSPQQVKGRVVENDQFSYETHPHHQLGGGSGDSRPPGRRLSVPPRSQVPHSRQI